MEAAAIAPVQVLALSLTGGRASQVCPAPATGIVAGVAHGGHDPDRGLH